MKIFNLKIYLYSVKKKLGAFPTLTSKKTTVHFLMIIFFFSGTQRFYRLCDISPGVLDVALATQAGRRLTWEGQRLTEIT